jgi:hypothetical protein
MNRRTYAIVLQLVAIGFGIWAGIQIFESATGSHVSVGFR